MTTNFESQNEEAAIKLAKDLVKTRYSPEELKRVPEMFSRFLLWLEKELKKATTLFRPLV